jgi:hypothetical protein
MAAFACGAMNDMVEAMDVGGELYVSAHNLADALERAREAGREIERARWANAAQPMEFSPRPCDACGSGSVLYDLEGIWDSQLMGWRNVQINPDGIGYCTDCMALQPAVEGNWKDDTDPA